MAIKKLIIYTLFSLTTVFLLPSKALADVMPPDSHPLDRCVKVVNLNEFPDIVLIRYITSVNGKNESSQIKNNDCLSGGYKFNSLSIYWSTKDKPDSIEPKNLLLENVEWYGGHADQNNPLVKEDIEYSIAGFSGGKPVLYKSRQISEYNNGTPEKVKAFSNPLGSPTPSPEPVTGELWQSIVCFLRKLFGKSCL